MTLTRARQHLVQHSLCNGSLADLDHNDHEPSCDALSTPKQRLTRSSGVAPPTASPSASPLSLLRSGLASSMKRTVSSPTVLNGVQTGSSFRTRSASSSSSNKSTATHPPPPPSSTSSHSSSLTRRGTSFGPRKSSAADGSDSSDDEDGASSSFNSRYGGCSSDVDPSDRRNDDSNKENIAPPRRIGDSLLLAEAQESQNDNSPRRNSPRGSLSVRRTSSSAGSVAPSVRSGSRPSTSRRSTTDVADAGESISHVTRRTSSRLATATPNTPESRKRQRSQGDNEDAGVRTPSTPMTRLRIDAPPVQEADGYFSSQGTPTTTVGSLFDASSQHSSNAFSRCTTPEVDSCCEADVTAVVATPPKALYSNVYAHARALLRYAAGTSLEAPSSSTSSSSIASSTEDNMPSSSSIQFDGSYVEVVGRQRERQALHAFMSRRFGIFPSSDATDSNIEDLLDGNPDSGSLYICGLPGTGKTALVRSVLTEVLDLAKTETLAPRVAFINCMAVDHPRQIFVKVLSALGETIKGASESHTEAEAERKMDKIINESSRKTLIVLDEIDHLLRSRAHQNVLYRLFAWASEGTSCGLIGIANSLDLTERFVPLLASKGAAPALLHFRPFESKEIVDVLKARLNGLRPRYDGEAEDEAMTDLTASSSSSSSSSPASTSTTGVSSAAVLPLFIPAALELASKRIAAATGDLRKALDTARLAVELVEGEQRKQALANCTASGTGTNTEASKLLSHLTPSSAPKVTPSHIVKVLSAVLGSPHLSKIRQLGLQSKLLLAAYLVAEKRAHANLPVLGSAGGGGGRKIATSNFAITVSDVEATYNAMLSNDGSFTALESSEILEILHGLEVQGTLSLNSEAEVSNRSNSANGGSSSSGNGIPSSSSSSSSSSILIGSGVSPGGKRAAKKQLLASKQVIRLILPREDVQKGITTVASTLGSHPSSTMSETTGALPSQGIVDAIKRMLTFEEERIRRSRGWEEVAKAREEVRREELGGGRMALGI